MNDDTFPLDSFWDNVDWIYNEAGEYQLMATSNSSLIPSHGCTAVPCPICQPIIKYWITHPWSAFSQAVPPRFDDYFEVIYDPFCTGTGTWLHLKPLVMCDSFCVYYLIYLINYFAPDPATASLFDVVTFAEKEFDHAIQNSTFEIAPQNALRYICSSLPDDLAAVRWSILSKLPISSLPPLTATWEIKSKATNQPDTIVDQTKEQTPVSFPVIDYARLNDEQEIEKAELWVHSCYLCTNLFETYKQLQRVCPQCSDNLNQSLLEESSK